MSEVCGKPRPSLSSVYLRAISLYSLRKNFLDQRSFYLIYSLRCMVPVLYVFQFETVSFARPFGRLSAIISEFADDSPRATRPRVKDGSFSVMALRV